MAGGCSRHIRSSFRRQGFSNNRTINGPVWKTLGVLDFRVHTSSPGVSSSSPSMRCLCRNSRSLLPSSVGIHPTPPHSGQSTVSPWFSNESTPHPQHFQHLTSRSGNPILFLRRNSAYSCLGRPSCSRLHELRAVSSGIQNWACPGLLGKGITSRMLGRPVTN